MRKNEEEIKQQIKKDLINKDLNDILKGIISFIMLSIIFGYIGYKFCIANNYDVQRGIVFSILFAIGLSFLKAINRGKIAYIIYVILYLITFSYIPTLIGIVLIFILILLFIAAFVVAVKRDRTEEIETLYRGEYRFKKNKKSRIKNSKEYEKNYKNNIKAETKTVTKTQDIDDELPKEKFCCERCFKEISEEEYELHDGMCEECFDESHYDSDGNPRKDYWNY